MFLLEKIRTLKLLTWISSKFPGFAKKQPDIRIKLWPKHVFFLLGFSIILGLVFLAGAYGGAIKDNQLQKRQNIGDSAINQMLFDHLENNKIEGKIITDYYWITALPGFEGKNKRIFLENDRFIILSNSDSYELVDPNTLVDDETFGFLISDMYFRDDLFSGVFQSKITGGDYSLVFSKSGYHFLIINR
jgi:hypothetical protein